MTWPAATAAPTEMHRRAVADRMATRTLVAPSGCHIWMGSRTTSGYGQVSAFGRTWTAHRVAYAVHVAPVPAGLVVDHLCGVRRCVNPRHLQVITQLLNLARSQNQVARHVATTSCPQGHPYSGRNLRVYGRRRFCRTCNRSGGRKAAVAA